ncbi:hypothetical protein NC653_010039 [Populus alba x Populus x berolinensis]|uniref:Uncharacterized protein n=1 Tax=Populus alba x Populus x berolinensis TaxID=444605 RepID=A0AAD6QZ01_9ROSI|nr:hypothetical protein NC653_010039 [Populus alba x Populus x berolinensis]
MFFVLDDVGDDFNDKWSKSKVLVKCGVKGKNEGHQIAELERLNYLGGGLIISDLGNVKDLTDAKSADLMRKTILQSSTLSCMGMEITFPGSY